MSWCWAGETVHVGIMSSRVNIILVGVTGFGTWHLNNLKRLESAGKVTLTALVDPLVKVAIGSSTSTVVLPEGIPIFDTLKEAISSVGTPGIVIVSVPIHLHAQISADALLAGADVYLEKPPFATMDDFYRLRDLEKQTGHVVQIGFQSLGSTALTALENGQIDIGKIQKIRAVGLWLRKKFYWHRSRWAGKRSLGDLWVMDGVATNALAHAIMACLRLGQVYETDEVERVEIESYRANPIDGDDTMSMRITPKSGPVITAGLTLCASEQILPYIDVVGDKGVARYEYSTDIVAVKAQEKPIQFGRKDLVENLVDHITNGETLLCPLSSTGGFMKVVEAIHLAGSPIHVDKRFIQVEGEGDQSNPVIKDIEQQLVDAVNHDALFSEAGIPWAFTGKDKTLLSCSLGGSEIFEIKDGVGTKPSSSPRPYLHPIRTLGGVEISATRPADHCWHHGLGFPIPDIDGLSYWGGGTYIHGEGYVMLENHGTITTDSLERPLDSAGVDQELSWWDLGGQVKLRELRQIRYAPLEVPSSQIPGSRNGWELFWTSSLTPAKGSVSLGSPGTNGRENAGYGGFFWRLPVCSNVSIWSDRAEGEDAVHGSIAPYMAWSASFAATPGHNGDATLVLVPNDEVSAKDPWMVRLTAYPGIGSAVAWKERTEIAEGSTLVRGFRIGVFDGLLSKDEASRVAGILTRHALTEAAIV